MTGAPISVVPIDRTQTPCACCSGTTIRVTGDLTQSDQWLAFFSVVYSPEHPDRPADLTLGYGDWTDTGSRDQRWVFGARWSLSHRAFMLSDLSTGPSQGDAIHLDRADILDTPFASKVYAMLDAVLLQDHRLTELHP